MRTRPTRRQRIVCSRCRGRLALFVMQHFCARPSTASSRCAARVMVRSVAILSCALCGCVLIHAPDCQVSKQTEILKAYVLSLDVMHPPDYWEYATGILVIDPDGWDRAARCWKDEWGTSMTYEEFRFRCSVSTCLYPRGTVL